jgi:hypothetical protein
VSLDTRKYVWFAVGQTIAFVSPHADSYEEPPAQLLVVIVHRPSFFTLKQQNIPVKKGNPKSIESIS